MTKLLIICKKEKKGAVKRLHTLCRNIVTFGENKCCVLSNCRLNRLVTAPVSSLTVINPSTLKNVSMFLSSCFTMFQWFLNVQISVTFTVSPLRWTEDDSSSPLHLVAPRDITGISFVNICAKQL